MAAPRPPAGRTGGGRPPARPRPTTAAASGGMKRRRGAGEAALGLEDFVKARGTRYIPLAKQREKHRKLKTLQKYRQLKRHADAVPQAPAHLRALLESGDAEAADDAGRVDPFEAHAAASRAKKVRLQPSAEEEEGAGGDGDRDAEVGGGATSSTADGTPPVAAAGGAATSKQAERRRKSRPDPFARAKEEAERRKREREEEKQRKEEEIARKKAAQVRRTDTRHRLQYKRTQSGQPVMRNMIDHLLAKLQAEE